jgi:hypothetical protein
MAGATGTAWTGGGGGGGAGTLGMSAGGMSVGPVDSLRCDGAVAGDNCCGGGPAGCDGHICASAPGGVTATASAVATIITSRSNVPRPVIIAFFDPNRGEFKPPDSGEKRATGRGHCCFTKHLGRVIKARCAIAVPLVLSDLLHIFVDDSNA